MAFPFRWCWIWLKRNWIVSILTLILLTLLFSIFSLRWSDVDARVGNPKPNVNELTISRLSLNHGIKQLNRVSTNQSVDVGEIRAKMLREKIQRIAQKVNKPQTLLETVNKVEPNSHVHAFYYAWYGNVEIDGNWSHWNHLYLTNWKKEDKKVYPTGRHKPPEDIGANFYPLLGCYSSRDPKVIDEHMRLMHQAGIGVVVLSWYPEGMTDSPEDVLPLILDAAHRYKLKVAPHIEPYMNRNPINLHQHISHLIFKYGNHPALYRMRRLHQRSDARELPVFYIYDSYLTPAPAWRELLSAKGNLSLRGTHLDAVFLGLLVEMQHRYDIKKAHFDGFYTYFATNGFTYGSTWKNWRSLSKFAHQNGLIFIPSVGPGYIDTQVRPWNNVNARHRRHGKYYEVAWRSALSAPANFVSITSFNEWHEGTQIEPAVPHQTELFTYMDYKPEGSHFYINLTRWYVNEMVKRKNTK
ncbi:Glycoprotein endo-alpha-1,2-mannosidase [Frankliniella fusca]|uniref:Glycoprotein endo-alpha-1,2-mannosidase n=1 Tax=Frankliniella fusca TaxID=407009 RepID=A0AAE1HRZ2_9NEOP|nr:Glycoprotein endo-alpha-1,2-mannosidase [Frankliniella fusca]